MLPIKPRGVRRVKDRRALNGIFWVSRSGAPGRNPPDSVGSYTSFFDRFVTAEGAGVCDQVIHALAADSRRAVQMIDTSIVRVHQREPVSPSMENN
jgi:transposase